MKLDKPSLMWRLFWTYALVLTIGITLLELNNIFVMGISLKRLLAFNIPAVVTGGILMVLILQAGTYFRLRSVRRYMNGDSSVSKEQVLYRLLRFPKELFVGLMAVSILFSGLFHLFSDFFKNGQFYMQTTSSYYRALMHSLISEQLLSLTLAVMLFSFSRSALRPHLLSLESYSFGRKSKVSFISTLLITMACTFAITFFSVYKYVLVGKMQAEQLNLSILSGIFIVYLLFSLGVLALLAVEYKRELQIMTDGFQTLSSSRRLEMHGKMPIMSLDEMGQLTEAFNSLQERRYKEYEELEKELELAYKVQQQLLPKHHWNLGNAEVSALCIQHKEVGGDLFDIVELDSERFIVMIGDVSGKGMPAALVMSTVLTFFRSEVKYGDDPIGLMQRLNHHLVDTLQGNMYVTLGLAFFDRNSGLEYVSAGHLAPYLIRGREVQELEVSSLPLGIDTDVVYRSLRVPLAAGDRLLLITDGVVEAQHESGELFGFERLNRILSGLSSALPLCDQLSLLAGRITTSNTAFHDDRTLVLLHWKEEAVSSV